MADPLMGVQGRAGNMGPTATDRAAARKSDLQQRLNLQKIENDAANINTKQRKFNPVQVLGENG